MRKIASGSVLVLLLLLLAPVPADTSGWAGQCQYCREWGGGWAGETRFTCWIADQGATLCFDHFDNLCWVDGAYCECITATP